MNSINGSSVSQALSLLLGLFVNLAAVCGMGNAVSEENTNNQVQVEIRFLPRDDRANDDVWISRPLNVATGTITTFSTRLAELQPQGPQEQMQPVRILTDRIVTCTPAWSDPSVITAYEAFRAKRWPEAISRFTAAVKRQPPFWQQQWLSADLATALLYDRQYPSLFTMLEQVDRQPLPAPFFARLPIAWWDQPRDKELLSLATMKLDAAEPLVRLLAASFLLGTEPSPGAVVTLKSLQSQTQRPLIAQLAQAQLWRIADAESTLENLPGWQAALRRLPASLMTGPMATMAERCQQAGDDEQAEEYWLAAALLGLEPTHPKSVFARQAAGLEE